MLLFLLRQALPDPRHLHSAGHLPHHRGRGSPARYLGFLPDLRSSHILPPSPLPSHRHHFGRPRLLFIDAVFQARAAGGALLMLITMWLGCRLPSCGHLPPP